MIFQPANITRRAAIVGVGSLIAAPSFAQPAKKVVEDPEWLFVPTPNSVVDAMLKLAKVTKNDLVLDLGSGDGRIPIAAAQQYGARGRGVDINPVRVEEAQANAKAANVVDRVTFVQGDVFHVPISDATVVTLYLFQHVMNKLMPRLRKELKPGTRVVSHRFTLGDWEPKTTESVGGIPIHLWIVD
jgi:cyclopropane fatty-acyl-phospholipid synthase-like methyltransferase